MERVQRLYDCITEVSDQYIQEAESFENRQGKTLNINWKQWGSIAAALAVVVGIGLAVGQMGGGSADSSAPAMSAPACSAPAASAPAAGEVQDGDPELSPGASDILGDQTVLRGGAQIHLSDGKSYVILSEEEALQLGLPKDLEEAIAGEAVCWLTWRDGAFFRAEEETEIALYPCTPELVIISDGTQYLAAKIEGLP